MNTNRRTILGTIAATGSVGVGGALAGCSGLRGARGTGRTQVDLTDDLSFDPDTVTVSTGDLVVWDNIGSIDHTVTAYADRIPADAEYFASGGFDTEDAARDAYPPQGTLPGGETYEYTFEVTGSYGYFCIPHETAGMVGTVVVE